MFLYFLKYKFYDFLKNFQKLICGPNQKAKPLYFKVIDHFVN